MKFVFLILLLIATSGNVLGEIYKWVDDEGNVHFSDQKPESSGVEEVRLEVNTYTNVSYDTSVFDTGRQVVMYSTSWCGYCKMARKYFRSNGIAYTEHDIEKSQAAKREYDRMGARGVPVILVGDKRMNGFSESGFRRIYDQ
ncbi:glutaredoxin family protein [Hahella ganghwensis]|uniref:glutaredoxin family protein n=1 Tax=Hahella ganghwensis TaxID=286420 RepID=UPI00036955C2|nr:glutaredoxin family protein [Hahella ganghwensis]